MILGMTADRQFEQGFEANKALMAWLDFMYPDEKHHGKIVKFVLLDEGGAILFTRINEKGEEYEETKYAPVPPPVLLRLD